MTVNEQNDYFREMKHNLQLEGVVISSEEAGILTITLDNQRLCQITDSGGIRYWKDDVSDEARSTTLDRITDIAKKTAEYVRLMETASCLSAGRV